jgi:hypothetical protein
MTEGQKSQSANIKSQAFLKYLSIFWKDWLVVLLKLDEVI